MTSAYGTHSVKQTPQHPYTRTVLLKASRSSPTFQMNNTFYSSSLESGFFSEYLVIGNNRHKQPTSTARNAGLKRSGVTPSSTIHPRLFHSKEDWVIHLCCVYCVIFESAVSLGCRNSKIQISSPPGRLRVDLWTQQSSYYTSKSYKDLFEMCGTVSFCN